MSDYDEEVETHDEAAPEVKKVRDLPEVLEFTLERAFIPVRIKNPTTDRVTEYKLQELDGTERDKYLNVLGSRMKVTGKGIPAGVKDFKDLQADLVSRSLVDADGTQVPVAMIQRWPVSIQTKLFKMAQKLSALEEESEKDAKND